MIMQMGDGSQKEVLPTWVSALSTCVTWQKRTPGGGIYPGVTGRHIISGHDTNLLEMAATLLPKYGNDYPIPRALPKWLMWLVAPMVAPGINRRIVSGTSDTPGR